MEGEAEGREMQEAKEGSSGDGQSEGQSFGDQARLPTRTSGTNTEGFSEKSPLLSERPRAFLSGPSCALAPKPLRTGSHQVFPSDIPATPQHSMSPF